jgi:hypothetical protein
MKAGEANGNGQELVRKTDAPSTTHRFAKIWVMRCQKCGREYGSNSCDAHIRRCPFCSPSAAQGEPI